MASIEGEHVGASVALGQNDDRGIGKSHAEIGIAAHHSRGTLNLGSPAEVDTVIEEARAAGATIRREPAETLWGGYSGVFLDPDGHPWEVANNRTGRSPRTAASGSVDRAPSWTGQSANSHSL